MQRASDHLRLVVGQRRLVLRRLRLKLLPLLRLLDPGLLVTVLLQRAFVHIILLNLWLGVDHGQLLWILLLDEDRVAVMIVCQVTLFDPVGVTILHGFRIDGAHARVHFCLLLDDLELVEPLLLNHFEFDQVLVELFLLSLLPGS